MHAITGTDPIELTATLTAKVLTIHASDPTGHPFTNLPETKNAVGRRPEGPMKETYWLKPNAGVAV